MKSDISPLIKQKIEDLVRVRRYDAARTMLQRLPDSPTKRQYLADIDALETPADKIAKGANRAIYYTLLVIALLLAASVIFAVIWTALKP